MATEFNPWVIRDRARLGAGFGRGIGTERRGE